MRKLVVMFVCAAFVWGLGLNSASALPQFDKAFKAKYVKDPPSTDAEKSLADAVATVKCNVCHEGTVKKNRNAYGMALDELLSKDDKEDTAKIEEALDTVAKQDAPGGGTFGERIAAGKLPVE